MCDMTIASECCKRSPDEFEIVWRFVFFAIQVWRVACKPNEALAGKRLDRLCAYYEVGLMILRSGLLIGLIVTTCV